MTFLTKRLTALGSSKSFGSLVGLHHSTKTPKECVIHVREALLSVSGEPTCEKVKEQITKYLPRIKCFLLGTHEDPPSDEQVAEVVHAIVHENTPPLLEILVTTLSFLHFEERKDVVQIFNGVLHSDREELHDGVEFLLQHPDLLQKIASGYENVDIALNCGAMLRECIKHARLARQLLFSPELVHFFKWVELKEFEAASDAFTTFKELLITHKTIVAEYLESSYDEFFEHYTLLLKSENYVTRRLSLKLLSEILLDRANGAIMMKYIEDLENLKLMMMLLKDQSKNIQYEAFHVFKVFVANPNRPVGIAEVLKHNRDKMLRYLENFHNDRDDEQFKEEKQHLIRILEELQ
eukprot:CAMPEP_0198221958 /NCGR_PEP_ID=MMETSP1445-20131203/86023_1 /TAXON_ID=36898 /ORGANISM="Pyramimonas sp., Strain CCMP2087" /LENGTH=350 /DNA_ID=CAMNT_0043900293 /DNA_START=135 /DNA_END=1187 /DNA_ORIENTATION=+